MLTVKVKKRNNKVRFTEQDVDGFIKDSSNLPRYIRCMHLKNKPMMLLPVCLKKMFVNSDMYPECKGCKQVGKYKRDILAVKERRIESR